MSTTLVPWTTPGNTPCCCETPCYTDLETEPLLPYSANTWLPTTNSDYVSLLAGGTYETLINIDVTGSNGSISERHRVINASVVLNLAEALQANCYERYENSVSVQRTLSTSGSTFDYITAVRFSRSLGVETGNTHVSFATVCPPPSSSPLPTFSSISLSGLSSSTFGINVSAFVGDFSSFVTGFCRGAGVPFTSSLIIGANNYLSTGTTIACFVSSTSMNTITHTGSMSFVTTFTPNPP